VTLTHYDDERLTVDRRLCYAHGNADMVSGATLQVRHMIVETSDISCRGFCETADVTRPCFLYFDEVGL